MSFSNFDERAQSADFWQDQEVLTKILEQEEGARESIQNRQTERHKAMPLNAAVFKCKLQNESTACIKPRFSTSDATKGCRAVHATARVARPTF
jgi:hypothetical protein